MARIIGEFCRSDFGTTRGAIGAYLVARLDALVNGKADNLANDGLLEGFARVL